MELSDSSPVLTRLSPALLIKAVQELSAAQSLLEIMTLAKVAARAGSGADGVSFVLRDSDKCHYVDEDSIAPLWKGRRFPMSACVSGWTMLHRQAAVIPDTTLDPRIPQDAYRPTFVRSLVMVPIRSTAPIGAIGAYWATVQQVSPETVHWLQALADATSAGIEAVRSTEEATTLRRAATSTEIVRMCAWSRRLQCDNEWVSIEAFLAKRFGLHITHGISDEVARELLAEVEVNNLPARQALAEAVLK